ncbi:PREDICTED: cystatin-like [Nanorana parkeri]|uniref:cystatin-like n=1 Tax=Nanorana parkeri TaxID=125878 RepID=UPI000854F3C3|nr:PREDICTED: cystatin-like [Nanorana parkeri]
MTMYWKVCAVVALTLFALVFAQQRKKVGGWSEVKEDSSGVQNALKFAQEEFNRNSNDGYIMNIKRTIKIMRQIVAGTKYRMEVEVAMSSCKDFDTEQCPDEMHQTKICKFEVLIVPWQNVKELWNSSCK